MQQSGYSHYTVFAFDMGLMFTPLHHSIRDVIYYLMTDLLSVGLGEDIAVPVTSFTWPEDHSKVGGRSQGVFGPCTYLPCLVCIL